MRQRRLDRPLRVATVCGSAPLILGSVAFFGWLLETGGKSEGGRSFQQLGAIMLTAGPALLAAGLAALWTARHRGATVSQLSSRALLIITNVPLAFLYLEGTSVAAIQRVEVVNRSGQPIEALSLIAGNTERCEVGSLADGASHVWKFCPRAEGALSVVGRQAGRSLSVRDAAMFYVFDRVDVWLVLEPGGAWDVREQPGAPWSWLPGR